jgi:phosphatidate cytidylyltransferase
MAALRTRLVIGISIAVVTLGLLALDIVFDSAIFVALMTAFCTSVALFEFYAMVRQKGIYPLWRVAIPTAFIMILGEYYINHSRQMGKWDYVNIEFLIVFAGVGGMFAIYLFKQRVRNALENIGVTIFGLFYIWGLASFIMRIRFLYVPVQATDENPTGMLDAGLFLVILLIAVAKMNDSCAFFAGRLFGKHKLAPKISPNKTVEGLVGGLIGGFPAALAVYYIFEPVAKNFGWEFMLVFTLAVGAASHLGDLAESMIKRDVGVKDSSSLFPEIGGFLDLIDGLLFASPVAFFVTVFMTDARFYTK